MDVLLALRNGNCYLRVRKTASDEIRRTVSFSFLSYSPTQALASNVTNRSVYMRQLLFSSIVRVAIGELGRAIQMAIGSLFGQFMGDNIKMRKWEQTTKSIGIIRIRNTMGESYAHAIARVRGAHMHCPTNEFRCEQQSHLNWMSRRESITFRVSIVFVVVRTQNATHLSLIIISFSRIYFSFNLLFIGLFYFIEPKNAAYLLTAIRRRAYLLLWFFIVFACVRCEWESVRRAGDQCVY